MAKVTGEIVMQVHAAFTDAQMQAGFIADIGNRRWQSQRLVMPQGLPLARTEKALSPVKAMTRQSELGLPSYYRPCRCDSDLL